MADLPLENGIHKDNQTLGIACTKDRYQTSLPTFSESFIKPIKTNYSRDEVIKLLTKFNVFTVNDPELLETFIKKSL